MYRFLNEPNLLIWNTKFTEADVILEKLSKTIPSAGMLYGEGVLLQDFITGDTKNLDIILKRFSDAEQLAKRIQRSTKLTKNLALQIQKHNLSLSVKKYSPRSENIKPFSIVEVPKSWLLEVPNAEKKLTRIPIKDFDKPLTDLEIIEKNLKHDLAADRAICTFFIGISQILSSSYFKGGYNLRWAWKSFEQLYGIITSSENEDDIPRDIKDKIEFGYGVFLFIVSIFPPIIQKVLYVVGFKFNRREGVNIIQSICKRQGFLMGFGAILLAINYLFIPRGINNPHDNLITYKPYLDLVMSHYNKSAILTYFAVQFVKKFDDTESAIKHLENAVGQLENSGFVGATNFVFELGYNYFLLGKFDVAIKYWEKIISNEKIRTSYQRAPFCAQLLSMAYVKVGKVMKGVQTAELSKLLVLGNKKMKKHRVNKIVLQRIKSIDKFCTNGKRRRKDNSNFDVKKFEGLMLLLYFEILLLRRDLAHLSKKSAEKYLKILQETVEMDSVKSLMSDPNIFALHGVVKAEMLKVKGDTKGAKELLKKISNMDRIITDKQWVVLSKYNLGEMFYFEGRYEVALGWVKSSKKYSSYPYENVMKARAGVAMKQINRKMKEPKKKKEKSVVEIKESE